MVVSFDGAANLMVRVLCRCCERDCVGRGRLARMLSVSGAQDVRNRKRGVACIKRIEKLYVAISQNASTSHQVD